MHENFGGDFFREILAVANPANKSRFATLSLPIDYCDRQKYASALPSTTAVFRGNKSQTEMDCDDCHRFSGDERVQHALPTVGLQGWCG
jgi:hypothetical protein